MSKKFWDWTKSILIALIIALFIRTFFIEAFKIPSGSMEPTLLPGDYILVNKISYGIKIPFTHDFLWKGKDPKVGDIVVFRYPPDPSVHFIKRCMGVPGDTVQIINRQVYINGKKVYEPYAYFSSSTIYPRNTQIPGITTPYGSRDNWGPVKVPPHEYFMMGDNRDNSYDSRFWGFVPRYDITGEPFIIYFSIDNWKIRFNRILKIINTNAQDGR
jgi:signal peptidase I